MHAGIQKKFVSRANGCPAQQVVEKDFTLLNEKNNTMFLVMESRFYAA